MKLSFVSDISLDSELRYVRGLISGFRNIDRRDEITIYVRKDRKEEKVPGAVVKKTWSQLRFPFQIVKSAIRDRQNVVHVLYDTPTFGLVNTPILLPLLFLFLRISHKYASVTIHAVPPVFTQKDMKTMTDLLKMRSMNVPSGLIKLGVLFTFTLVGLFAQRIVVHTPTLKNWLVSDYKIPESKIVVIPHGSNIPSIVAIEKVVPPINLGDRKFVLYFGRLNPRKGIELLLLSWSKIFSKYPEYLLVIAGTIYRFDISGQYYTSLKKLSSDLGTDQSVIFSGRLPDEQVEWLYLKSEFVVLPYQFSNAASGPLAIAISFGKPVIASSIGAFNDEIINNINGLLVRQGDELDLRRALESMIGDQNLRARLKKNAKEMIRNRTWNDHAKSLESIWSERKNYS